VAENIKTVMVVGKYFGSYDEIEYHIFLARQLARMIWCLPDGGIGVFTPHLNTAHFEALTDVGEPTYQAFDRAMIERTGEAGVLVPNWRNSSGSLKEIRLFNELGRPVFEDLESLVAWRDGRGRIVQRTEVVRGETYAVSYLEDRQASALTEQDLLDFRLQRRTF